MCNEYKCNISSKISILYKKHHIKWNKSNSITMIRIKHNDTKQSDNLVLAISTFKALSYVSIKQLKPISKS